VKKEILINVDGAETRVAVLEDGKLVEISLERPEAERAAGNVYKAKVENVLPGMQAAFVDIGLEKNAFLYVADAAPIVNFDEVEGDEPPKIKKGLAINKLLKPGQKITVQVTKDPIGTKGARVSAYVTLPSHYVVLMPTVDYVGVSRRIADPKERQRLRGVATKAKPRGMGVIVRTAAEGHDAAEVKADIDYLASVWRKIQQRAKSGAAPRVLHQDMGLVGRVVRDVVTESVARVVVDSVEEYDRVKALLQEMAPALADRVELHDPKAGDLFGANGVEAELDRALSRRVWLRNGGYLVIDETEAFTVFDVNTGRYVGSTSLAQTVLDTNLEAAAEIARQLRLRDIGGIIVIDFIDMDVQEHRQKVIHRLEEHLRRDRTRSHVLGLTELGLVEMTRKKVRQSLGDAMTRVCPTCEGRGRVMSEETVAARVRRELRELLRTSDAQAMLVEVHPSVAALLIGSGGAKLREMERELGKVIYIRGSEELSHEGSKFRLFDTKAEVQAAALPVQIGDVVDLRVEEQHVSNRRDGISRIDGYVLDIEGGGDRVGERVKVEISKVHRTFARARILGPERAYANEPRQGSERSRTGERARDTGQTKSVQVVETESLEITAAHEVTAVSEAVIDDASTGTAPAPLAGDKAATTGTAANGARRSSRRRRRGKGGSKAAGEAKAAAEAKPSADTKADGEGKDAAAAKATPEVKAAAQSKADSGAAKPQAEIAASVEGEVAAATEPQAKRKSRRRRSSRRKKAATPGQAAAQAKDAPGEVGADVPATAAVAPEKAPAAAAVREEPAAQAAPPPAAVEAAKEVSAAQSEAAPAAEKKPAAKRSRRPRQPRKPKAPAAETEEAARVDTA